MASLRRLIGNWVMGLPAPVLRALSGGEALLISGRRLDPQIQMLAHGAKGEAKFSDYPAPVARAAAARSFKAGAASIEVGVTVTDFQIPAAYGSLQARRYHPDNQHPTARSNQLLTRAQRPSP